MLVTAATVAEAGIESLFLIQKNVGQDGGSHRLERKRNTPKSLIIMLKVNRWSLIYE